jgi:hypothetical protein
MLSACGGGSNDTSSPAQTNQPAPSTTQSPSQSPAQSPAPPQTNQPAPPSTQTPSPGNQPQPGAGPSPVADPLGRAELTDLTLTGISATFTAPQPASGGQEQVVVVQDTANNRDEFTSLNSTWENKDVTAHLDQTGTATYHIDRTSAKVTHLFTGAGIINTEAARFGDVLAGETGMLTVTANYTLAATPGVSSTGEATLSLFNQTTKKMDFVTAELPNASTGTLSLTVPFNAGDTGSLMYSVSLRSEGTIAAQ